MSKKIFTSIFLMVMAIPYSADAQNTIKQRPIIQTKYTADPAPMVYNDTVFLYTSHHEDDAMDLSGVYHGKSTSPGFYQSPRNH
jgi:arabinoxylan arabinofuranohydrolase